MWYPLFDGARSALGQKAAPGSQPIVTSGAVNATTGRGNNLPLVAHRMLFNVLSHAITHRVELALLLQIRCDATPATITTVLTGVARSTTARYEEIFADTGFRKAGV